MKYVRNEYYNVQLRSLEKDLIKEFYGKRIEFSEVKILYEFLCKRYNISWKKFWLKYSKQVKGARGGVKMRKSNNGKWHEVPYVSLSKTGFLELGLVLHEFAHVVQYVNRKFYVKTKQWEGNHGRLFMKIYDGIFRYYKDNESILNLELKQLEPNQYLTDNKDEILNSVKQ
jgi:hypothetical protein